MQPKSRKQRALEAFHGRQLAEGGQITDNYDSPSTKRDQTPDPTIDEMSSGFVDHEGDHKRPSRMAMSEDDRSLGQHGEDEMGPEDHMAEGGMAGYQDPHGQAADDLVSRIMKQRMYSEGGRVANEDSGESASTPDRMAKDLPNEFDDLALRDDLESSDTGANSGDELSDDQEDMDRRDIVSRIMRSRAKRAGSLPKTYNGSGA